MPTKILAIDDSKTMRLAIKITFAAEDCEVVAVSKGSEAVVRAKQMPADILIVDAVLAAGEPSGYEVARMLRADPPVLDTIAVYGVRVLVPIARALQIPVLGRILASLEWWARDSFLRGFGAHLLVVLRKDEDADRAASNRK